MYVPRLSSSLSLSLSLHMYLRRHLQQLTVIPGARILPAKGMTLEAILRGNDGDEREGTRGREGV